MDNVRISEGGEHEQKKYFFNILPTPDVHFQ